MTHFELKHYLHVLIKGYVSDIFYASTNYALCTFFLCCLMHTSYMVWTTIFLSWLN